ncbi:MAG: DUF3362 domain-containing protein [Candidatus Atribacteria bacterium]|nr:DUF3362 domain-containing protein [Candidatus Atribacteria bacterium]
MLRSEHNKLCVPNKLCFMAAHPGCREKDMLRLKQYIKQELQIKPEQVQIFIPAPATYSAVMYYTGRDPFTGKKIFVEKAVKKKDKQKRIITE